MSSSQKYEIFEKSKNLNFYISFEIIIKLLLCQNVE